MESSPSDTHPDVENAHIRLLSDAGPSRRLALARSLSQLTMELSRRALQKRAGDCSQLELAVKTVALCYGEGLAERVKMCLESRPAE